tara:strand:+ start:193 stop:801 length:609 start_codon:yes stop_codon:yes gene_type:complete
MGRIIRPGRWRKKQPRRNLDKIFGVKRKPSVRSAQRNWHPKTNNLNRKTVILFIAAFTATVVLGMLSIYATRSFKSESNGSSSDVIVDAHFRECGNISRYNCVIDGDTLRYKGTKIRIADIDTPETHPPRCAKEARLGDAATKRLQQLLNLGPFELQPIGRDEDRYGRKLRILYRDGQSIGQILVQESLARPYQGGQKQPWC